MENNYISISAFAVKANVSPQCIYQKLKNDKSDLNKYVKTEEGKKLINLKALELFQRQQDTQDIAGVCLDMADTLETIQKGFDSFKTDYNRKDKISEDIFSDFQNRFSEMTKALSEVSECQKDIIERLSGIQNSIDQNNDAYINSLKDQINRMDAQMIANTKLLESLTTALQNSTHESHALLLERNQKRGFLKKFFS